MSIKAHNKNTNYIRYSGQKLVKTKSTFSCFSVCCLDEIADLRKNTHSTNEEYAFHNESFLNRDIRLNIYAAKKVNDQWETVFDYDSEIFSLTKTNQEVPIHFKKDEKMTFTCEIASPMITLSGNFSRFNEVFKENDDFYINFFLKTYGCLSNSVLNSYSDEIKSEKNIRRIKQGNNIFVNPSMPYYIYKDMTLITDYYDWNEYSFRTGSDHDVFKNDDQLNGRIIQFIFRNRITRAVVKTKLTKVPSYSEYRAYDLATTTNKKIRYQPKYNKILFYDLPKSQTRTDWRVSIIEYPSLPQE